MRVPRVTQKPAALDRRAAEIGCLVLLLVLATAGLAARGRAQAAAQAPAPAQAAARTSPQAPAQTPAQAPAPAPPQPNEAVASVADTTSPATTALESTPQQPAKAAPVSAGGGPRQKIDSQCADLLKMAASLKSEVDKTTMDELSVAVVRTADEVEQLAHKMKDEIKRSADK